ncbi:phospholipase D-like domain-containing protein [Desulfurivibrio dismutans]|uniref:phospholipase D-like domain-containing protein n=1 Tax=Desulfurivibrio dismutans TaxID=1398908 RepID=UPI0023DBCF5F|nr:phospholipase D-like domain-containing protein [Desulfurivibrio alkaliphilus]MDF1615108.1 phospholipase D-like domain-containing protein [Desulfurivibrio alkaliphilus]
MSISEYRFRYPWRPGNQIELLVDGEKFFPAMLAAIDQARRFVLLEFYLFESGRVAERFIAALCDAGQRGVYVGLLLDDFGARKLLPRDRQQLLAAGARLRFYNPLHYGKLRRNLFRDHRKLLIIDGRLAFTGGTGIADEFETAMQPMGWHDVMLRIQGPVVADWMDMFLRTWRHQTRESPTFSPLPDQPERGGQLARLVVNLPTRTEVKRSLLKQLRQAKERIWIATAYFIPSWKIRRRLRRAVRRGVDVRLLLPGPHTDHPSVRHAGRRFYASLLRSGVRIFEYQPRFIHAKIQLCDDWVSIGSSNIDRWNLRWSLEANQEVRDRQLVGQVAELFEHDFAQSHEMLYSQWRQRSWYRRLPERFWGWMDRWLERFSQR